MQPARLHSVEQVAPAPLDVGVGAVVNDQLEVIKGAAPVGVGGAEVVVGIRTWKWGWRGAGAAEGMGAGFRFRRWAGQQGGRVALA